MNKDKTKFGIFIALLIMVSITFAMWFFQEFKNKEMSLETVFIPVFMIIILSLLVMVFVHNYKSIKQNEPVEDERSKKATMRAASLSFFISIYLLLFIGWFGDDYFERASQATGLAIGIMAVIFISLLLYFQKRGKL
jgi:predicted membrane protein